MSYNQINAIEKNDPVFNFLFESFDGVDTSTEELPAYWAAQSSHALPNGFKVYPTDGINNSQRLSALMSIPGQVSSWTSPKVYLQASTSLRFQYRVVRSSDYPLTGIPNTWFSLSINISNNGGETYETLEVIGAGSNHTVSNQYAFKEIDLSAYTDDNIIIQATVNRLAGGFYVDFDDITIGEFSNVEFTIQNSLTEPLQNATISSDGFSSIQTDALGKANIQLPNGTYSYSVSAESYLTFTSGSFVLEGEDIVLAPLSLIGNFPFTFTVTDQDAQPVPAVEISYEGVAEGYDGPQEVEGTVFSNLEGNSNLNLTEGEYSYLATKAEYYQASGSFNMGPGNQSEPIILQIHPLVTFTVVDEADQSLAGVNVLIEGSEQISTNASGIASLRLPLGNYEYTVNRTGYFGHTGSFDITVNEDLILPTITLFQSPPAFMFITDVDNGLTFRKTLINRVSPAISVTFTNTGSGEIVIAPSDIVLNGADADQFHLSPIGENIVLGTDDQATITLTFAPDSPGLKTAELQIEDNINKQLHTVSLQGLAYEAISLPFLEDFEAGDFNNWVVVNGTQTNQWHLGEAANDSGNFSAFISNNGGITNAYQTGGMNAASVVHFYMDFDIPNSLNDVILSFNWKGNGEAFLDLLRVYNTTPNTTPLAGSTITGQIGNFYLQPTWQTFTYTVPESHKGQTRRFVFTWINNASGGLQPPIAVDNIKMGIAYNLVTEADPEGAGTVSGSGNYLEGIVLNLEAAPQEGFVFSHWSATAGSFADMNEPSTTFTMPGEDATVTAHFFIPEPQVVDVTVTYDGTEHTLADGVPPGVEVVWFDAEEDGNIIDVPTATNAGVYTAWAAVVIGENESSRKQATLTISPREINVLADDQSKVYGENDPELTFQITEGELAEGESFAGELGRTEGENVGTYEINQGTLALNDNYILTFDGAEMQITQRFITISANNLSKIYGEDDPVLTYLISDGFLVFDDEISGEMTREPGEDAGSYDILQGTLTISDNYDITFVPAQLTITQRDITVTAHEQTKIYGDSNPELTWTVTQGELFFEDVFTGELSREAGEDAGIYNIELGTLALSDNYILEFVSAELTITQRDITVTADEQAKVYGDDDPELTWTLTAGEPAFDDVLTGTLSREAGENIGTYTIEQGTLTAGDNYILTFIGAQFIITTKELTIGGSFMVSDKEYDGTTDATIFNNELTLEGVVNDDDVELVDVVAAFENSGPGQSILVTIVSAALDGIDMNNYTLSLEGAPTTTASIIQPSYILSIDVVPAEGGTAAGGGSYLAGETASLVATPNTGYVFLRWEDENGIVLGEQPTLDYVMPAEDVTLTARFELENTIGEAIPSDTRLFPNPAREYVNITSGSTISQVIITDLSGKVVYSGKVYQSEARISTGHLPAGIYLVRIHNSEGIQIKKLQLQ